MYLAYFLAFEKLKKPIILIGWFLKLRIYFINNK